MTMFNKDQIVQLLESRDGEALRALWQGRGAVDIAALLDSVEDGARQAAVFRTLPKDLAATVVLAKLVGCMLPIAAKQLHMDPAIMASPLITTIVDAGAVLIYFQAAAALLRLPV